jgi:hypothetical protein
MARVFILGVVAAVVLAWMSAQVHASGRAPVGLVSIAVGVVVGAIFAKVAAARRGDSNSPVLSTRRLVVAVTVVALVTVLAQHAFLYGEFRRQWHEARARSPHAALFQSKEFAADSPASPVEYFTREATAESIALWCVDAALVVGAAGATMWWAAGRKTGDSA